jgi:XRE family transcriptional regulator, aerobic/anaerobic benzoate catabolism transcriptional regulator
MQYSASKVKHELLQALGTRVRSARTAQRLTQRELARRGHLSLRFLAQLERGEGNISLLRFADLAAALHTTPAHLLARDAPEHPPKVVALLGVRGAGKTTIGHKLAKRLGVPFVELDTLIERAAQLSLAEIFELHGEVYYRRIEREALRRFLDETPAAVLATGGSIVGDRASYRMLRERTVTVWLRARPEDHWNRVIRQGDRRPMARNPQAFAELRALLQAREPLYAEARHVVDTFSTDVEGAVARIAALLEKEG